MSDNDLIRRGDAKRELYREWCESNHEAGVVDYQCALDRVLAVPREMSAREYAKAINRVFYLGDDAYGEWADAMDEGNEDKAVAILEAWAREHSEERSE